MVLLFSKPCLCIPVSQKMDFLTSVCKNSLYFQVQFGIPNDYYRKNDKDLWTEDRL